MKSKLTLSQLEQKVKASQGRLLSRQKQRYELAKQLGFSPAEAVILQNQSLETIMRLAGERKGNNGKTIKADG